MGQQPISTRRAMRLFRLGVPCLATLVGLWLLSGKIDGAVWARLPSEIAHLSPLHLASAALFSLISLWAVGRYDGVAHRHLQTCIAPRPARLTGSIAIALSQTLGFGLFTGAAARWRLLPALSIADALRLSAFVCVSFLVSWAWITAFACLVLAAPPWTSLPAIAVVLTAPVAICVLIWAPKLTLGPVHLRLPSLVACGAIMIWAIIDLGAAALALYFLIPAENLAFATLLPVFLLALGAALLSGTPGGVGPFELVLLGLLPKVPVAEVLAGILGFRAVYYAIPAVLAMIAMLRPFEATPRQPPCGVPPSIDTKRAEIGVIRQNGGMLLDFGSGAIAVWPTPQTLTALGDPIGSPIQDAIKALAHHATEQNRIPCLYKCTARTAVAARQVGWSALHCADEAVLTPATFDLAVPARRALRRKLRHAEQAGVTTMHARALPLKDMAAVDKDWQDRSGAARGGTMGRFSAAYVADQLVFLAYQNGRLIAFASFHHSNHQWCLDLMRAAADAPNGTMHALVTRALSDAVERGVPQVSLAATPACPDQSSRLMRAAAMQVVARSGGPGLRQFKSCFAPDWQPLYVATRTRVGMAGAFADIAREVHHPRPLHHPHEIHNQDEDNEVALLLAS